MEDLISGESTIEEPEDTSDLSQSKPKPPKTDGVLSFGEENNLMNSGRLGLDKGLASPSRSE